jgi:hypothetical protein
MRGGHRHYEAYFHGDVLYHPHGHSHRVYYFPVWIGGYQSYRPHAYCGDRLFAPPRLGGHFGLHFGY